MTKVKTFSANGVSGTLSYAHGETLPRSGELRFAPEVPLRQDRRGASLQSSIFLGPSPCFVVRHLDFDIRILEEEAVLTVSKTDGSGIVLGSLSAVNAELETMRIAPEDVIFMPVTGRKVMLLGFDSVRIYDNARKSDGMSSWADSLKTYGWHTPEMDNDFLDFQFVGKMQVKVIDDDFALYLREDEEPWFDYSPATLGL